MKINNYLIIFLVLSIIANAYLFVMPTDLEDLNTGESTRFILSPGKNVYLGVKDHRTESDRQIAINANPGQVVDIRVREARSDEEVETFTLDEFLSKVLGHKNQAVKQSNSQFKALQSESLSRLQFSWQMASHTQLEILRKKEKLDEVIKGSKSELEKFIKLQNWVRAQWIVGAPDPYPAWNANQILGLIRSGKTGGFCGQYSQVLVQCLQSFGYKARYLWLKNHFALEVFWNEGGKWIVLDPLYSAIYKKSDSYLNAFEIYSSLDEPESITLLNTKTSKEILEVEKSKILKAYSEITYDLKADHLSEGKSGLSYVSNYWQHSAVYLDKNTANRNFNGKLPILTERIQDLYFLVDDVKLKLIGLNEKMLTLELKSHSDMTSYEMSVNGSPYKEVKEIVSLPRMKSILKIKVRGLTTDGVIGPVRDYEFTP
jgi:hypothetical protein